jgi:type III secretion protein C
MKLNAKLHALALSAALAAMLLVPSVVCAEPVPWKSAPVDYAAEGKDIKEVLRDFAASQGVAARIAADVTGTVSGKFHLPPRRFLDALAASFGFVWYYDGEVLDIVAAADMQTSLIKLDTADVSALRSTLTQMGVADDRFHIVYNDTQGTALVSGPPRYVQLVSEIAARLDANASRRGGTQVRVFPLDHAWADDRTVSVDGHDLTLHGVATVLNGIYHPQARRSGDAKQNDRGGRRQPQNVSPNTPLEDINGDTYSSPYANADQSAYADPSYLPPPVPTGAAGRGLFGGLSGQPSPALAAVVNPPPARGQGTVAPPGNPAELPVIVADQRTNSIIVRDTDEHMAQYGPLIQRLDVKPQLIEIEAHIIEIDDTALQQLGVDWTAHSSHIDVQTGSGTLPQATFNGNITQTFGQTSLPGNVLAAATPAGASVAAVLGDAGRYLLARISALQQNNTAKIDASPKVVTLNNIEAVMSSKQQFFVPVQGYTAGDLYSISTGISLRVLPMAIDEDGKTRIKLDVAIQDGELTSQTVSNLPVIQNSDINTQAFIDEGQALLIAGYRADNDTYGVTGVPLLSKIPLIGALFRTNSRRNDHMERLFLLLPRVITPS